MIIQEDLGNGLIGTYSNLGVYIHGGYPESDYDYAIDPVDSNRTYIETDILIEEPTDETYAQVGKIMMGVEE